MRLKDESDKLFGDNPGGVDHIDPNKDREDHHGNDACSTKSHEENVPQAGA